MQLATDLGELAGQKVKSNLPELPNTIFMAVIRWVLDGNDNVRSPTQLQAPYTDVKHWKELIDFTNKNGCPKEPYILTSKFQCTLEQDKSEQV